MATDELTCARCRRPVRLPWRPPPEGHVRRWRGTLVVATKTWPEGHICTGCFAAACETYGRCADCETERLLPGRNKGGRDTCADCAGLPSNFRCSRCGIEGWIQQRGTCDRCVLGDRLNDLLDDGTGHVRRELKPLRDKLTAMPRPRSGLVWLAKPHVPPILRALARGDVPLTHAGLLTLTPWRSVIYVRDLLVSAGVLPEVDRSLLLFEHWLPQWLATVAEKHQALLRQYATWQVLRELRRSVAQGPVGPYRVNNARSHLRHAARFLADIDVGGTDLADLDQTRLDRWYAAATSTDKDHTRPFLAWLARRRLIHVDLPQSARTATPPISQAQRATLIRKIYTDPDIELGDQVLGLLVLLYAQPLSRIVRLSIDDVLVDEGAVSIRLGTPPAPVPAPFDVVFLAYIADRPNRATATNPSSRWLFPGRRADQPLHTTSARLRLRTFGIPNLDSRRAAIRNLLKHAPPVVVADMISCHHVHAEAIAAEAGSTWQRYAALRSRARLNT